MDIVRRKVVILKLKKAELMKEHGTGNRCRCSFFENGGIRP